MAQNEVMSCRYEIQIKDVFFLVQKIEIKGVSVYLKDPDSKPIFLLHIKQKSLPGMPSIFGL